MEKNKRVRDSDSEEETPALSPKKKKTSQQCRKSSYFRDDQAIVKSSKGDQYAFCKACESHLSVANDVFHHVSGSKHKGNKKSLKAQPAITGSDLRMDVKFSDLSFFLKRYPVLRPATLTTDDLTEAFAEYQQLAELPCCDRVDHVWSQLGQKYPHLRDLASVMKGVVTIPHSSAPCERIFSVVRKNATEDRKSMHENTLESLLVLKAKPAAVSDTCTKFKKEELAKLKSAHYSTVQARKRQAAAVKKAAGKQSSDE